MRTPCHRCKGEGEATVSREESHDKERCPRCKGTGVEPLGYDHVTGCVMVANGEEPGYCLFCGRADTLDTFSEAWDYKCPGDAEENKGLQGLSKLVRGAFENCGSRNINCATCASKRPECHALDILINHASSWSGVPLH